MAKGERNFSTQGQQVTRFSNEPFPPGEYELKLVSSKAEVKAPSASNPRGAPYVGGIRFIALGTGNGGKDKSFFHMFLCSLHPGNDGKVMPNRSGGITEFAQALGDSFSGRVIEVNTPGGVKNGQELPPETIDCLDPKQLLAWLKERDGQTVRAKVKIQKGTDQYPDDKNVIDYFIPAEATAEDDDEVDEDEDEELDEETESDEDEDADEDEDSDEDTDEDEPEPAPKASKVKPLGAKAKVAPAKKKR